MGRSKGAHPAPARGVDLQLRCVRGRAFEPNRDAVRDAPGIWNHDRTHATCLDDRIGGNRVHDAVHALLDAFDAQQHHDVQRAIGSHL